VPEAARFCPSCGHSLGTARLEERRVVTVLFADLVGFTSLAETLDPESVKHLVDGCFELLVADVVAFGGRVDKIVGDAIVALFGAPVAHQDDAERAVRAALRMHQTLANHCGPELPRLEMRVGVNTGEVLVGALRSGGDYTAMGDVVNAAERLQTAASPGEVLVGPATHAATLRQIGYEAIGLVRARGREEPIEAWRATEPLLPPGQRGRKIKAPFVGRDTEMTLLLESIGLAYSHHRPFLVVIEGEGGVGKSRLAREAIERARVAYGPVVLVGRCMPYGEPSSLHPMASAIATHIGVRPEMPAEEAEALVGGAVLAACSGDMSADPNRVTIGLLHLLGRPTSLDLIDPTRARDEMVQAVLGYLYALARGGPLMLIVADLDWADPLLVELLERALSLLTGLAFTMLTTSRPGAEGHWPPPPGRHNTLLLRVDPLERAAAERLAAALLPRDASDELRAELLDRSAGNPLFLEELAVAVKDCGTVAELPDTLRGLVAARLDRLDPAERAVVENAAVLGPTGTWEYLEHFGKALGQDPQPEVLAALADAELLDLDGDRWSFRSESVRDVAYQMLTKSSRAQRHAGVAHAIEVETGGSDVLAEQIAHHYACAARLVREIGPVSKVDGDVAAKAASWYARAAARALDRMTPRRTARLASDALEVLGPRDITDPLRRELVALRSRALVELHEMDAARADAIETLRGAELVGDTAGVADARTLLGEIASHSGDFDGAVHSFEVAVAAWREVGDRRGEAEAQRAWGLACLMGGEFADAERHLASANEVFEDERDRRGQAWVEQHRAWISFIQGDMARAEERLNDAATTFRDMGDEGGLSWVHGLLAFVRYQQGRFEEADALAREVAEEALLRDEKWGRGMMLALQSALRLWTGRVPEAVELGEEAWALLRSIGDQYGAMQAAGPLSRALVASGRIAEAYRRVEETRPANQLHGAGAFSATVAAGVAAHAGDAGRAVGEAHIALERLHEQATDFYDVTVTMALALLQQGRVDEADEHARIALDMRPGHPNVESVAALAALAQGRVADAVGHVERARTSPGATYFDIVIALVAQGLACTALGDEGGALAALDEAVLVADGAGDVVVQAVARLAGAEAKERLGRPEAAASRLDAMDRLRGLGQAVEGWARAVALAAQGGTPAPRVPVAP
jgi:class 3 adenylate cyclase/tetratricopeptide (TPR) repeat protein